MSVTVVTFKDEGCDEHGPFGPVVVIQAEGADAEAAAAAGGIPFAYRPEQANDLGWKPHRDADAIAGEHGVPLTHW
jgi:hypothetical protein